VKTRLIPALGAEGAAALAGAMLERTVEESLAAGLAVELCGDPHPAGWFPPCPGLSLGAQGEGELGERLARAAKRALAEGPVLLVGADCPALDRARLAAAAAALEFHDAALHPAEDGGYVLLGLRRFDRSLFEGIAWSTATVAAETVRRIEALGWSLWTGETLKDVDEPGDLPSAHRGEGGCLPPPAPSVTALAMHPLPPYAELLGLRTETMDGETLWIMPFRDEVVGRPGFLHGGAIAGLLEFAALGTVQAALEPGASVKPINVSVDFLRGGLAHDTFASATITRLGNRVANVEAHAWQKDRSKPIAAARMNLMVRR
jgi:uncharacterized protein